ncbi:hypothetical protein FB451DRAFT_1364593 [Mycena latifolia]|nr:hypothetical protein FB451DRAFT_1364593 [Mycena latifolia]
MYYHFPCGSFYHSLQALCASGSPRFNTPAELWEFYSALQPNNETIFPKAVSRIKSDKVGPNLAHRPIPTTLRPNSRRTPGLGRVLQGPSKASSSLGPPREDTPPLSSPRKALSRPIQTLSRSAARPSKVERTEVLLSHIFHSDHHHGLKHLLYPPLTLRPRSRTIPYSHSYPVGRRKLAFYERNAGSAMGSFRMNRALLHRSIASTGPLLLGYGAGKEVHILRARVDEHTPSLFPFSEPPSSHLVLPQPKLRTRARDGSGEESAAKVAQPSALDSSPKVLKSRRRAKARPTLVFPHLHLRWCTSHATPGYVHFPPRVLLRLAECRLHSMPRPLPRALDKPLPSQFLVGHLPVFLSTLAAIERLHSTLRFCKSSFRSSVRALPFLLLYTCSSARGYH